MAWAVSILSKVMHMTSSMAMQWKRSRRFGLRLRRDEDGATAVEFGLIALPFFMMLFGILSVCHLFFWVFTAENAVWTASRDMRTGAFQTAASGSPYAGLTGDALKTAFRKQICKLTVNYNDCVNNSVVLVQSSSTFSGITQPSCTTNANGLVSDTDAMAAFNAGAADTTVMVTLCYGWGFGAKLPFLPLPKMSDGSFLIQASAAFRTEPYN
jgi:Flp pilus assembly protein TadG